MARTKIISNQQAKKIASNWHNGQASSLYSYASTGKYLPENHDKYIAEINSNPKNTDMRKLRAFFEYCKELVTPKKTKLSKVKKGDFFKFSGKQKIYKYEGKIRGYNGSGKYIGWVFAYTPVDDAFDQKTTKKDREVITGFTY